VQAQGVYELNSVQ